MRICSGAGEAPLQIGRRRARRRLRLPHGQRRLRGIERGRGIGQVALRYLRVVVEDELLERRPDDGGAVRLVRHRQEGHDVLVGRLQVALPADAHEREAPLEERGLAGTGAAPVGDRVVDRPVPTTHVDGPVDLHGGAVLDVPARVAGRVLDVDDALVAPVVGVDLAVGDPAQQLVAPGGAEAPAVEGGRLHDLQVDACDLGLRSCDEQRQREKGRTDRGRASSPHRGLLSGRRHFPSPR